MRKIYVDGPTGQVHVRDGQTGVPLILLHQSPHSSRMFLAAFGPLQERGIRPIAIDTPGFGMSDVPNPRPSIETYASAIPVVMDALAIEASVVLGHHTGASIAIAHALAQPHRVTALILNGPPLYDEAKTAERLARAHRGPAELHADGSHLITSWNSRSRATPGWTDLATMHRSVVDTLFAGDTAWYGHLAVYEYPTLDRFKDLAVPLLILTNSGDPVTEHARIGKELRPDAEYVEMDGGTHDIVDEQPEAWADAVADYTLRLSERTT